MPLSSEQISANLQTAIIAAQASEAATGLWTSLTAAQWAQESGYGEKAPRNNAFGITYNPARHKQSQKLWTHEEIGPHELSRWVNNHPEAVVVETLSNGNLRIKLQRLFAAYDSLSDGFKDHADLLTNSVRYYHWWLLYMGDPTPFRFIDAISSTYATDTSYPAALKEKIAHHALLRFDHGNTPQEVQVQG